MNQEDNRYIQTLTRLGLTLLQATIYIALVNSGKAGIKKITKVANIARTEVYRVLPSLEEKGLVEKIVSNPTMYEAAPLKQGVSMLLQQKTKESTELLQETEALLSNIQEKGMDQEGEREEPQLVITTELKLFLKRIDKAIMESQRSIDFVCINRAFPKALFHHLHGFKAAMDRGIKIRVVTEKAENQPIEIVEALKRNPRFNVKYTAEQTPVCMLITDGKKVNMQLSDGEVPSLFSNNLKIVKIAAAYFRRLWSKADLNPQLATTERVLIPKDGSPNSHMNKAMLSRIPSFSAQL